MAINQIPMATNQGFKSLIPKADVLEAGYLAHWLKAHRSRLESLGTGATFKEISKAVVGRLEIPLPPLAEQRRIAAILDHANAIREQRRRALALWEEQVRATFMSELALAGQSPVATIAELASGPAGIRTGPFGSQLLHSEFVDSGIAVLGIDNAVANEFQWSQRRYITAEKYAQLRRYTVHPGDVIITLMGTCGRVAIVPDDIPTSINTKHLCCITVDRDRCLPEFLHASFLWQPLALAHLAKSTKGGIMDGLNMGIIKETPIIVPPIHIQLGQSQRMRHQRNEIDRGRQALRVMDALLAALQTRAFTGEL